MTHRPSFRFATFLLTGLLLLGLPAAQAGNESPPHSATEFDVARGLVPGQRLVNVFGDNPVVGDTEEVIWVAGGVYTGFITVAANIEVVSSSANDDEDGGGTNLGAHSIFVAGLDENWDPISVTIELNGTSANVATGETSWIRVNEAHIVEGGTYTTSAAIGSNIGVITIRLASGGVTMASSAAERGKTEQSIYSIPAGESCALKAFFIDVSVGANKTATVQFWQRPNADDVVSPFAARQIIEEFEDINGEFSEAVDYTIVFSEKTGLWWTGIRIGSDASVDVDYELRCYTE